MNITMSYSIAVDLYEAIIKLKPVFHSDKLKISVLIVVMTYSSSDCLTISKHNISKEQSSPFFEPVTNPFDELKLE